MKNCELCKVQARTFCDSDQASLCWDCDATVHGANFLVARHTRTLLCHACQSPTPWKASGERLGNTVSLCVRCAGAAKVAGDGEESQGGNDGDVDTEDDDLDDEDDEDDEEEDVGDEDDGDNQVVPWSSTAPPPPAPSSSSSEESVSRCNRGDEEDNSESAASISLKRRRQNGDRDFQEGSSGWRYKRRHGGEWREEVNWLGCGGEPPSKRGLSGGEGRPAALVESFDGPRGCCCDGRASSEDV